MGFISVARLALVSVGPLIPKLVNLGRLRWFDVTGGLHNTIRVGGATRGRTGWARLNPSQSSSPITWPAGGTLPSLSESGRARRLP